jgi:hypothetical protein
LCTWYRWRLCIKVKSYFSQSKKRGNDNCKLMVHALNIQWKHGTMCMFYIWIWDGHGRKYTIGIENIYTLHKHVRLWIMKYKSNKRHKHVILSGPKGIRKCQLGHRDTSNSCYEILISISYFLLYCWLSYFPIILIASLRTVINTIKDVVITILRVF